MSLENRLRKTYRLIPLFVVGFLFVVYAALMVRASIVRAAMPPAIITYQGKLLANSVPATSTLAIRFVVYDSYTNGTALYTASGTLGAPSALSVTPVNGIFTVDLGGTGTNALDPTIFQNYQNLYLEVTIGSETLTPRKQLTASPFALNSLYLGGVAATSTASSSTYIPVSDANGNFNFNHVTSTGLVATGTSTLATTTITSLTVGDEATAQALRDGLGWLQNQMGSARLTNAYANGGFGSGATPGNITMTSTQVQIYDSGVGYNTRGVVFDGRYLYYVPYTISHGIVVGGRSGEVVRYDTTAAFVASSSFQSFDTQIPLGADSLGFSGGIFDGHYVYFVPFEDSSGSANDAFVRYNTRGSYTDGNSWSRYYLTNVSSTSKGFNGAAFDGRYIYLVPNNGQFQGSGVVTRYDTTGQLNNTNSYSVFDMKAYVTSSAKSFIGAVFDGRYIYYVPHFNLGNGVGYSGTIVRFDTTQDFAASSSYAYFDTRTYVDSNSKGFNGAVFDGRYVYFVPEYKAGVGDYVTRYDTQGSFTTSSSYTVFSPGVDSNFKSIGYSGAVFDGRYIYLVPNTAVQSSYYGQVARYDTAASFTKSSSWSTLDLEGVNANDGGFFGGAFDGHYVYLGPGFNSSMNHGLFNRIAAYTGGVDTANSLAKLAKNSDLYITPSSTVLIGTTTLPITNYQLYVDAGTSTRPGIGVNGYIKASGFITGTTTLDLAEVYPLSNTCMKAGTCPRDAEVVCLSPEGGATVERCAEPYSARALGVVSTDPGFTLGGLGDDTSRKIALAGRVPLYVSTKNGTISPGDRLTSSDLPGIAMKALNAGPTIGIALDSYSGENVGKIVVFVKTEWWGANPTSTEPLISSNAVTSVINSIVSISSESLVQALSSFGISLAQNLLKVVALVADKITTNQLCLGSTCITETDLQQLLHLPTTVIMPAVVTPTPTAPDPAPSVETPTSTPPTPSPVSQVAPDPAPTEPVALPPSEPREEVPISAPLDTAPPVVSP